VNEPYHWSEEHLGCSILFSVYARKSSVTLTPQKKAVPLKMLALSFSDQ
jgi:hypothetical protein